MAMWLDNPIAKLTRGYEKFRQTWPAVPQDGWGDLVVPTVIRAGQVENAIPDTAEMLLNVRSVSTDAVERVTKVLKDVAGLGIPVVIIGSMGGNAHGKGEWGDLTNMDENADSLVKFLSITGGDGK